MSFQVHAGNMGMILYVCIQGQLQQFAVDLISLRSGASQEAVGCVWFSARRCSLSLRGLTRDRKQLSITGNCYKLPSVCIRRSLGFSVLVRRKPHKFRRCNLHSMLFHSTSQDYTKSCNVPLFNEIYRTRCKIRGTFSRHGPEKIIAHPVFT